MPLTFQDSVRIVLENTRNVDAAVIAAGFAGLWDNLRVDQQKDIQAHARAMRLKRYPLKPNVINYYGAIVNAVTVENIDAGRLNGFLDVCGKVIENETAARANNFLGLSRQFFLHHSLHHEKSFSLVVMDDQYAFDYIGEIDFNELPPDTSQYDNPGEEQASEEVYDEFYEDTVYHEPEPLWMTPPSPPTISGPVIKFTKVTLNFVTPYDSVFIKNTSGQVSLINNVFVGELGSFDWSAAGLPADSVYCNFTTYFFDIRKSDLRADLVNFNYTGKTQGLIPGAFDFQSQPRKDSTFSDFPRFKSYQSNLNITGLAEENLTYTGGFSLFGNRITSASFTGDPATIQVSQNGLRKFNATSSNFSFEENMVTAERAAVTIFHGSDSLSHPSVQMKYTFSEDSVQRLFLRKDKGEMRYAPYSSTFFNIDFAVDAVHWDMYADSLNLLTEGGRATVPMIIESVDYYDLEDYRLLKGVGFRFHPLVLVASYALRQGVTEFYSGDIASGTGLNLSEIKNAVNFLSTKGMLTYDPRTDRIQLKEKALDFYRSFKGEVDYDNLKVHSVIDSFPNATMNTKKGYLTIRGVEEFDVSDSLNVHIVPDSSVITMMEDRNIKFNGTISAGNFEISGKDFTLNYHDFLIDLGHIDSINFFVMEKNAKGQQMRRKINNSMVGSDSVHSAAAGINRISQKSGTLYISEPDNKSGKKKIPHFPRLDASAGGVIYFDHGDVLAGAYDRSMFFVVPPFKLDSLNDADPAAINFDGTFVSGMFPNFKEKLHTQPDKSLGFEHFIPKEGYNLYRGDARMSGILNLNNRGLRGAGHIDYLAARISSDDFIFYPDSVVARGEYSTIQEKQFGSVLFPQASLSDFEMKWLPREDRMMLKNRKAPFNFYDSTAQMQGTLTISKNGVAGVGKVETRGTELISRDLKFTGNDFSARHARFKVRSADPDKPLFTGTDVRLKFNIKENFADISPEVEGVAAIDFPYAQFKTSIPKARWYLDQQKILMSKDPNVPLENSYFYTTRKELDSLHFNAEKAEYNLQTQELKVSGIPYIIVADAKITPENNEVLILENAKIGTLKNTTIVLDTLNEFHRLTDGVVDIVSRKEFGGYATYQYINLLNDTFAIKMTDFHLEPIAPGEIRKGHRHESVATMQTVATGSVQAEAELVLGAGLYYKGDMIMYSTRPALQLDGYVKLDIKNIPDYNAWIKYTQSGEETDVAIHFDDAVTEEGKKATAGLHIGANDHDLYATFINDKKSDEDDDFFTPSGSLIYDNVEKEYRIEDLEKAAGHRLSGKVFAYNDETRSIRFEGPINLFNGAKDFNITASAIGSGNLATNELRMNALVAVESNVPATAFDLMARHLQEIIKNEGAHEGLGDHAELLYKIGDLIGEKAVKEYEQKSLQGHHSLATFPEFMKPLVFADVNLKWHPKLKAFYSEGILGLSNILKHDINGGFEGFMEIRDTEETGPTFNVFIKGSSEAWYYFGFEGSRLLVHSSNGDFNDVISKRTNAGKAKVGEIAFVPGTEEETLAFINRFRKQYYGIEVPYDLSQTVEAPSETIPVDRVPANVPDNTDEDKPASGDEEKPADEVDEDDGF